MTTLKIPHLVLGLVFLGVAVAWLLLATGVLQPEHLPYVAPAVLVGAGVLGLLAMVLGARRSAPERETGYEPAIDYPTEDDR